MKGPKPPNTCCLWGLCCWGWGWACWGWGPPKPRNLVLGAGAGAGTGAGAGAGATAAGGAAEGAGAAGDPPTPAPKRTWGLGMATTAALITRRVGGTKRKYSMVEGEGLCGRREGGSPRMRGVTTELCCTALVWGPSDCSNPPHPWTPTFPPSTQPFTFRHGVLPLCPPDPPGDQRHCRGHAQPPSPLRR